jgi:hypothetical protein
MATTQAKVILGERSQDFCKSELLVAMVEWNCGDDSVSVTKEVTEMCQSESEKRCEHPGKLKGKPGQCSPEQIKECHGDAKKHPCVKEK